MTKAWLNRIWQLGLGSYLTVGSAIALSENYVFAQIQPDSTLGGETSVVNSVDANSDRIDGGAIRNNNLFHSFQEFNVDPGKAVYFANPQAIENIFSRVTGRNPSQIQGVLGVSGKANLFLLNPNGIVFGENASLNVQGSFTATTADKIEFGDHGNFSAVNPETPQLLTINPSAFSFNRVPTSAIVNRSRAADPTGSFAIGLSTQPGKTLSLVGGNINLDNGLITAPGGRVELGGLIAAGVVAIDSNNSLIFPDDITRADVSIRNNTFVVVSDLIEGGSISVNARNLELSNSSLVAGSVQSLGMPEAKARDIMLNATEKVKIESNQPSLATTILNNAGNIIINTGTLEGFGNFTINSIAFGEFSSGDITIIARDNISLIGTANDTTFISSISDQSTKGNAGDITINTPSLFLSNITIGTSSSGQGDAGDIQINTTDSISSSNSFITASILGEGSGGKVTIESENGNVSLNATRVGAFAIPNLGSLGGTSGDISIKGRSLSFTNGTNLFVDNDGLKNAGNISIEALNDAIVSGGSQIGSNTGGKGDAGNVNITAKSLLIKDGSIISANTFSEAISNGGNIGIKALQLFLDNNARITASSLGIGSVGNAGNIRIAANSISIANGSNLIAIISGQGKGNAGAIEIATNSISIVNNARLTTSTFEGGEGGRIQIAAEDSIFVDSSLIDSGVLSTTEEGNGGEIKIETTNLLLNNGAILSTQSSGKGNAGNIIVNADSITLNDSSIFASNTPSADISNNLSGGNITLQIADRLTLRNNSDISTQASSNANGGNIDITADAIIAFDDSDIFAFAQAGRGGNITLNTPAYFGYDFNPASSQIKPDSSNNSLNGNDRADINATGAVSGIVTVPDVSFIQNSLTELPENPIDTNALIANSCIARRDRGGTFTFTGAGGLPSRPGDAAVSPYPTGDVRGVESDRTSTNSTHRAWKIGDPIVEPQAAYRLADGQMVLSRECER